MNGQIFSVGTTPEEPVRKEAGLPAVRRILVTGAGQRIGAAIARRFATGGYAVAVHYCTSRDAAEQLCRELSSVSGAGHYAVQADFLRDSGEQMMKQVVREFGIPDVLVNSAACFSRTPWNRISLEEKQKLHRVNVQVPLQLMEVFARLAAESSAGSRCVVNLLDQRVLADHEDGSYYEKTKRELRRLTEDCALRWAPSIRVNGVAPGIVLPPPGGSFDKMKKILPKVPMRCRSTEEEIAEAVWFLVHSPTVTGAVLPVDGGLHLTAGAETPVDPAGFPER